MKIADPAPVACSVCLQPAMVREPRPRYVDFEAAYDGPVITHAGETYENYIPTPVDDLIICEDCLKGGAALIGLTEPAINSDERKAYEERIAELEKEVKAKDRAVSDLEHSLGVFIDHPVKRPARPPQIVGPEDKKDEVKTQRSRRRMAAKVSKSQKANKAKAKPKEAAGVH